MPKHATVVRTPVTYELPPLVRRYKEFDHEGDRDLSRSRPGLTVTTTVQTCTRKNTTRLYGVQGDASAVSVRRADVMEPYSGLPSMNQGDEAAPGL